MRSWRALARPYRLELRAVAGMTALMVIVTGIVIVRLLAYGIPTDCFRNPAIDACGSHLGAVDSYIRTRDSLWMPAFLATLAVPMLSGVVLGTAMLARELEQQTTVLAWSLTPSRVRWLLRRTVLVGAMVLVVGLVAGVLGDALAGVGEPTIDQARNFNGLGSRGPVVGVAAVLAFVLMLHAGAVLGRQLPSLLLGLATIVAALVVLSMVSDAWLRTDASVAFQDMNAPMDGVRYLDSLAATPDGIMTWDQASHRYGQDVYLLVEQPGSGFQYAVQYVPAELYPLAVARLCLLLGAAAAMALAVTSAIVHRRRPFGPVDM